MSAKNKEYCNSLIPVIIKIIYKIDTVNWEPYIDHMDMSHCTITMF